MHFWLHAVYLQRIQQCTHHTGHERQPILSGGPLHPLTFELRQRRKLDRNGVSTVLRGALGFSLLLRLSHGLPRESVHFLGCRDGRHFGALKRIINFTLFALYP